MNNVLGSFVLSRDGSPLVAENKQGRSYFSYGRTFYRAPTRRLYGRVHIDEGNTFILRESGIEGLVEVARCCRVPLHRAARSSIGTSMSSLQNYQALKDGFLVPRNKHVGEVFKSAYQLLVGDRGGFVYEPRMGFHEGVGEVDFSSMYPSLMAKYNISAETVLCVCCPDSSLRIPELGFHICEKRKGIVPKVLEFAVEKRLSYKRLVKETKDERLREVYDKRQTALKWILVTCFGYLGYKNAKFGTVDGHMGVCAFGRETLLNASYLAEKRGFEVMVFHTQGIGGIAMDETIREQDVAIAIHLSLIEVGDFLSQGLYSGGADRCKASLEKGVPTIFAPGNIDFMVAGPIEDAKSRFPGRRYHIHNPELTAVRAGAEEFRRIAEHMAGLIREAKGPVAFFVPLLGFSAHDSEEGHLHDLSLPPVFAEHLKKVMPAGVPVNVFPYHINDERFAAKITDQALVFLK